MSAEICLKAVNEVWNHYGRYTALTYPVDSNLLHGLAMAVIPQAFAELYRIRVILSTHNFQRYERSCTIAFHPLNFFVNFVSLLNVFIYFYPPFSSEKGIVKNRYLIASEIEAHAARPLLIGALTLILTGVFFGTGVIQHPIQQVRRVRPMVPFLLGCCALILFGAYIFYQTCQLHIKDTVAHQLAGHCE